MAAKRKPAAKKTHKLSNDFIGLLLIAIGIFSLISVFFLGNTDKVGSVGPVVKDILFGLFGLIAYVIPLLLIVVGWLVMISWKKSLNRGKTALVAGIYVLVTIFIQMCFDGQIRDGTVEREMFTGYVSASFSFGIASGGGAGALGGIFTWPIYFMLGKWGTFILVIAGVIACVAALTHFSLGGAGRKMTSAVGSAASSAIEKAREYRRQEEDYSLEEEEPEYEPSYLDEEVYIAPVDDSMDGLDLIEERNRRRQLHNETLKPSRKKRSKEPELIDLSSGRRIIRPVLDEDEFEDGFEEPDGLMLETVPDPESETLDIPPVDADVFGENEEMVGIADSLVTTTVSQTETVEKIAPEAVPPVDQLPGAQALAGAHEIVQEEPGVFAVDARPADPPPYHFPKLDLLTKPTNSSNNDRQAAKEQQERSQLLVETLASFGIESKVVGVSRGPALTRYELKPAAGVKVSRITGLADDIALNMAAVGVRIEAPIPGKAAIGIEVPNIDVSTVTLREVLASEDFRKHPSRLAFALGKDIAGKPIIADLARMPHLLIAGATGSGKSVCINSLVASILYKATPEEVKLIMIDPKVVELSVYNGIPHLLIPVVTDPKKAASALNWAVLEMGDRYKKFANTNNRDLKGYNEYARTEGLEPMSQLVVIIDELADLMMVASREVEEHIARLAQLARAAGIHLVIATQRPSVNVITGVIKANIPSRIAFAVASQVDSRTILDMAGAEKLLGRGDMLYDPSGASKPMRVQGCFISDGEVHKVVESVKSVREADYDPTLIETLESAASSGESGGGMAEEDEHDVDELLREAIELALDAGQVSASMLQRRYRIGYARAGRLIDEMEKRGIITGFDGSKPRAVLISREEFNQQYVEL